MFDRFQALSPTPPPRPRVDLDVPFAEKTDARALGARWDQDRRTWYVPNGHDPSPFARWLPPAVELSGPTVAARVIALEDGCWRCSRSTRSIVGVLVDDPELAAGDPSGLVEFPFVRDALGALLTPAALAEVGIGLLRMRTSRAAGARYMSNGCVHCDALQGDVPLAEALREYREEDDDLDALVVAEVELPVSVLLGGD